MHGVFRGARVLSGA
uniref:U6 snRNA-associated Sm-like protein LSm3 n=1 Tax=Rhizophora mucronata TaxID=61149 RepID=A0A2P2J233_RHIMU